MADNFNDHWAYFGDGNAAQILDSRLSTKRATGIRYIKFILIPSRRIENMYQISEDQDNSGAIVKEYKETNVIFLERGISRTRCWILTDFNGEDTIMTRRYKELTEALNDSDRLIRSAEAAKSRAYQELDVERQQKMVALKSQAKMLKEIAKARGRIDEADETDSDTEM